MKEGYEGLYVALGIVAVVVLIMVIIKPLTFGVVILLTATSSVLEDHFEPAVAAVVVSSASALGESVLDYVRWIADSRQTC